MKPYEKARKQFESQRWKLQSDLAVWQYHNFDAQPLWTQVMGATEEIGELSHAVLKKEQGIRGMDCDDYLDAAGDAVADCMIYLIQVCTALKLDALTLLGETAKEVMQRDWVKYPKTGRPEQDSAQRGTLKGTYVDEYSDTVIEGPDGARLIIPARHVATLRATTATDAPAKTLTPSDLVLDRECSWLQAAIDTARNEGMTAEDVNAIVTARMRGEIEIDVTDHPRGSSTALWAALHDIGQAAELHPATKAWEMVAGEASGATVDAEIVGGSSTATVVATGMSSADCEVYECPRCGDDEYPRKAGCCGEWLQSEDDMCRCDALECDR